MIFNDANNKIKKIVFIIIIVLILIVGIVVFSLYISKDEFRNWMDNEILKKEISTKDVPTIDLNTDKNNQVFCYGNIICILKDKILSLYNSSGTKETEMQIDINTAIYNSNDKYLIIAEKNGQNFCVILDKTYLWNGKIEGEILKTYINRNGYVAIVSTDSTFKSVITLFSPEGKQILKNYLSSTRIIDLAISNDNNYLAFAELDSSGALIKSNVKIMKIEKANISQEEAIVRLYEAPISKMITMVKYNDKNDLICMFDDSVIKLNLDNENELMSINNNITFVSANLNNHIAFISEENTGLFNYNSILTIENTSNRLQNTYHFNEVVKEMYTYENIIGVNVGTEIYFINSNGMLIKKYISKQEITKVLLSNRLGLIIYKDRIEIIDL